MRSPSIRYLVPCLAVPVLALSLSACGSAELRTAGAPGMAAGAGIDSVPVGTPVSLGGVVLCVSRPGSAAIRSVAIHEPTGEIAVEAFALRPNPWTRGLAGLGAERSTIDDLGLDFDADAPAKTVSGVCPGDVETLPESTASQLSELAVQVVRRSGDWAGGSALDVSYEMDGATRTAIIPFGIWLCAETCPPEAGRLYQP